MENVSHTKESGDRASQLRFEVQDYLERRTHMFYFRDHVALVYIILE